MSELKKKYELNIEQIKRYLPHRPPFLLVDRVIDIEPVGDLKDASTKSDKIGIKVKAQKCVTINEPHFAGHFPDYAIMPGVLVIESMAQTACFSLYPYLEHDIDRLAREFQCILIGVDGARFRRPVVPGDVMTISSVVTRARGRIWTFKVEAKVDDQLVAEAELLANLIYKHD